jgi:hypothetical protein
MKWFQHECTAKHDPWLQILGEEFGAEGTGVYWGLLEEIGHSSSTFRLKVTGASVESDRAYVDVLLRGKDPAVSIDIPAGVIVPTVRLGILARLLFTTEEKLLGIIERLATLGVFDESNWHAYGLLYSPAFEQRADAYTRRCRRTSERRFAASENHPAPLGRDPESPRKPDSILPDNDDTDSEKCVESVGTDVAHFPEEVRLQQTTEQKSVKEIQLCSIPGLIDMSTVYPHSHDRGSGEEADLTPSPGQFSDVCEEFRKIISEWNEHGTTRIYWVPSHDELMKLFYGRDRSHKLWLSRQAMNLTGGKPDFPRLVIRALNLMLEASKKQRIQNPFGWVWSCIHGAPGGIAPWVHLATVSKEARRITSPRSPL